MQRFDPLRIFSDDVVPFSEIVSQIIELRGGRKHIDVTDQLIGGRSGLNPTGPTRDEGNPMAAFEQVAFVTVKNAVMKVAIIRFFSSGIDVIRAIRIENAAVVAGDDD